MSTPWWIWLRPFARPAASLHLERVTLINVLLLALVAAGCTRAPVPLAREQAEPEVSLAEQAFGALKAKLMTRLTTAMAEGGPGSAITVCGAEAQALSAALGQEHGIELGRTSFRLRNAANAPRPWAATHVSTAEARGASFDLGKKVGVLAPIPLAGMCVACHGPRETLSPDVAAALAVRYPDDRAVGFAEGDLRGYFWAEVPKRPSAR